MASKVVLLKYIFKKRIKFTFYFACAGWWRGSVVHQRHKLACSSFEMCAEWTRVNSRKATYNNPLICSAINLKIHEKEKKQNIFFPQQQTRRLAHRERNEWGERVWVLSVDPLGSRYLYLTGERRKSSTKAKHHFKAQTNKPAVRLIMGI